MNRLKEIRNEHKLILSDVSKEIGMSKQALGAYEREERWPNKERWVKLAEYYNVDPAYIMGLSKFRNAESDRVERDISETGKRILLIRQSKSLTMEEFSSLIGASNSSAVNNWEKGYNLPNKTRLERIAVIGENTVDWLLSGHTNYQEEIIQNLKMENEILNNKINEMKKILFGETIDV
ncbi:MULTISPECIES: helix-turn-helix transcriptional regulator [Vagococcus]|nr:MULTISPECIES: helix-turn-helix transcriptional regulator [Vagococcus]HCM90597.1 XRE family transcriptional regulator [Vagococcus sp.]